MNTVGDVITRAWGEIEKRGWCKDRLMDEHGAVCAVGAVNLALYGNANSRICETPEVSMEYAESVYGALHAAIPANYRGCIPGYNNEPTTTFEDMREWFAKAAANAGVSVWVSMTRFGD